jgi:hypothetical protein
MIHSVMINVLNIQLICKESLKLIYVACLLFH